MPRAGCRHHRHFPATGEPGPEACPFVRPGKGGKHGNPFGAIVKEKPWTAGASGCGGDPVSAEEPIPTLRDSYMSFHFLQTDGTVGHQFIEVFHQHRFRKHWKLAHWGVKKALVKFAVKRRMGVNVFSQMP